MEASPKAVTAGSILLSLIILALLAALVVEKQRASVDTSPRDAVAVATTTQEAPAAPVTHVDPADAGRYVSDAQSYELEILNDASHSARFTDASSTEPVKQAGVWETRDDGSVFVSLFDKNGEGQQPVFLHFAKEGMKLTLLQGETTAGMTALTLTKQ
jgi:hypothetical protein